MKGFTIILFPFCFAVLVQAFLVGEGFYNQTDEIGMIGAAGSLYGRKFQITGGYDGTRERKSHYAFDLFGSMNWTRQPEQLTQLFRERSLHSSEVYQDFLFLFGQLPGVEIITLGTSYPEHNISWSEITEDGPSIRVGHSSVLYDKSFYLFGGKDMFTGEYLQDLWRADLVGPSIQWTLLQAKCPIPARAFHTAVLYQDSIYFFGGSTTGDTFLNDIWRYDIILNRWIRCFTNGASGSPEARDAHTAVYYGDEGIWVFGGRSASGYLNDMWRFDLQSESWTQEYQGNLFPWPRAFFTSTVIDEKWVIFGGQVGQRTPTEWVWNPLYDPRFTPIFNPDEYSGEVWAFDFNDRVWRYVGCLPIQGLDPINHETDFIEPEECISHHHPNCKNDCSGHGICVYDNVGQWTRDDCSFNICDYDKHRGYDVDFVDRVLISETILKLAKELAELKSNLIYIQDRIPSWGEFLSCIQGGEEDISEIVVIAASVEGVRYTKECMANSLLPVISEFNNVLTNERAE